MAAYYNEIDSNAAEWLRQLIKMGAIAPGDVDERSIEDVSPVDLKPYDQCHFFAGIGVWSYALRQAGIPDDYPVWTGSCPCQPFSAAGKGEGLADERHLWPAMFWLIQQCRPVLVFGEQVASKDGLGWWDIVASDLENSDYACAAVDLCAAGVGAPHIRQRLYWVANSQGTKCQSAGNTWQRGAGFTNSSGDRAGSVANACSERRQQDPRSPLSNEEANGGKGWNRSKSNSDYISSGDVQNGFENIKLGHAFSKRLQGRKPRILRSPQRSRKRNTAERTGQANFWGDCIWLPCSDGKARPVKPGLFPLVNGITPDLVRGGDLGLSSKETWSSFCEQKSVQTGTGIQTENTAEARTMRTKGYGNAIVEPLATEFIKAAIELFV